MMFISVLPHEALPTSCDLGYIHLQGSFVPRRAARRRREKKPTALSSVDIGNCPSAVYVAIDNNNDNNDPTHNNKLDDDDDDDDDSIDKSHYDTKYIEQKVLHNLRQIMLGSHNNTATLDCFGDLHPKDIISAQVILLAEPSRTVDLDAAGGVGHVNDIGSSGSSNRKRNPRPRRDDLGKVRLTLSSPSIARILAGRLKRSSITPAQLLKHDDRDDDNNVDDDDDDDDSNGNGHHEDDAIKVKKTKKQQQQQQQGDEDLNIIYSGKPLQITQVTPTTTTTTLSCEERYPNNNNSNNNNNNNDYYNTNQWKRAAPPKFRKLQLSKWGNGKSIHELQEQRNNTRYVYLDNILSNGDSIINIDDVSLLTDTDTDNTTTLMETVVSATTILVMKRSLLSIFHGTSYFSSLLLSSSSSNDNTTTTNSNDINCYCRMIEDDIRHAFQDALRTSIALALSKSMMKGDEEKNNNGTGVEIFMKPGTSSNINNRKKSKGGGGVFTTLLNEHSTSNDRRDNNIDPMSTGSAAAATAAVDLYSVYDYLHIGMRNNEDVMKIIHEWQGKRIPLSIQLPASFVNYFLHLHGRNILSTEATAKVMLSSSPSVVIANVITGKLFVDYADVMLPKGRLQSGILRQKCITTDTNSNTSSGVVVGGGGVGGGGGGGGPSRPECTSITNHIIIPGLSLIPNFISNDEEEVLLAALAGPHAPWAPPQYTPSGGMIRRRVQHYGYVFDYASSDVLRRDEYDKTSISNKNNSNDDEYNNDDGVINVMMESSSSSSLSNSACPPMPSMYPSQKLVVNMSNEEVERYIDSAVQDVKGWEALAGVIERTRRFNFDPTLPLSSSSCHPHLNQLTVNEYNPGQGIGSHIDTETAFGDGILIITLNGGIVMEFRKVVDDDNDSSSSITTSIDDDNNGIYRNKIQHKKLLYLPPRSLMLLSGDARYKWEHMIVSRTTDTVGGAVLARKMRLSLTLRTALSRPIQEGDRLMAAITSPLPIYESSTFPPRWGQLSESFPATATTTPTYTSKIGGNVDTCNGHTSATLPLSTFTHNRSDLVTPVTESKHVHAVYNAIATQWHHTRGKRGVLWPGATQFLNALPPGSLVADVGCGDGKYFSAITAASSYVIGTDISEPLLKTAVSTSSSSSSIGEEEDAIIDGPRYQRLSKDKRTLSLRPAVAVADCINLPLRSQSFDAAICIAVMHHLSTEGRRIRCLSELQRIVKAGGLINVMAWALEQEDDSKRKFHGTDVLVPFNAQPKYLEQTLSSATTTNDSNSSVNPVIETSTKRKGVAEMLAEQYNGAEFDSKKNLVVFQRYCHMYRRGELEELCARVPGLKVLESSYEKGNHVVLLRRL